MNIRALQKKVRSYIFRKLSFKGSIFISPLEVEKAERVFYINYLKPGMVVFDIGANIGELTLLFSRFVGPTGSVHSFEASIETFMRLQTVIELADCPKVQLNCIAVSDKVGVSTLYVYDRHHTGWTTLADRPLKQYGIDITPIRRDDVKTITIDGYCDIHGIEKIDLMKIDVEGAEYQVLLSAKRMLHEGRISCCVFEFGQTTFDMGNHPAQIKSFLNDCGYKLRNVIHNAPVFPGGQSAETARFSMHICTRKI